MEAQVSSLCAELQEKLSSLPSKRLLVGLSGIPGSGKSSLARAVVAHLNGNSKEAAKEAESVAIVVPMDGWHFSRAQLDEMPDARLAHDKRGAEWTFDGEAFAAFVVSLRTQSQSSAPLLAPTFSHSTKDPVASALVVSASVRIVVLEGLYCNVNAAPWLRAAEQLDVRWVVEIAEDIARKRLLVRHVRTGVAKDQAEAAWRADNNDLPNGRFLLANVLEPARRILSIDDTRWKGQE